MTIGTKSQYQQCINRAQRQGGVTRVTELGGAAYAVLGSRGDRYTVRVDVEGNFSCTCPAGRHDTPCWHAAAAWLLRIAQQAAGITPAAAPRESDADARARILAESRMNLQRHGSEWDRPARESWLPEEEIVTAA